MKLLSTTISIAVYKAMSPRQLAVLIRGDRRCIEPGQGGERFCYLKLEWHLLKRNAVSVSAGPVRLYPHWLEPHAL